MKTIPSPYRLLVILAALMAAGCSSNSPPSPDQLTRPGAEKPSWGRGFVNVDNGSSDEWELFVDGKKWCVVKPHFVVGFELSTGNHEFKVMRGTQEVDRFKAKVKSDQVAVINPGALSAYTLTTATYTTGFSISGDPPSCADLKGQRVCYAYYGLIQEMPYSIAIKSAVPQPRIVRLLSSSKSKQEKRTKLSKSAPDKPSNAEAVAMLTGNGNVYQTIGSGFDLDNLHANALRSLKSVMDQPEIRKIVLQFLESSVPHPALEALGTYQSEIPNEQIMGWLAKKDVKTDNEGHDTADAGRVRLATRILLQREMGAEIEKQFNGLPELNRLKILEEMDKAPLILRKSIIVQALQAKSTATDSKLRPLIGAADFKLDEAFIQKVDAYIETVTREDEKKMWDEQWGNKFCNQAMEMPREWVVPRLVGFVQKNGSHQYTALKSLIEWGGEEKLVSLFSSKKPDWKDLALRFLEDKCRKENRISDPALAMATEGLKDEAASVRRNAFNMLCQFAYDKPEIPAKLREALLREPSDATVMETSGHRTSTKKPMEETLARAALGQIKEHSPAEYLKLLMDAPCQAVIEPALKGLIGGNKRNENLSIIGNGFSKIPSPENRAWLLADLGRYGGSRSDKDFKPLFDAIFNQGLADPSHVARTAAVKGFLQYIKSGPESDAILKAIQAEQDVPARDALMQEYNLWLVKELGNRTRKAETQQEAFKKLIEIASSGDDEVAIAGMKWIRSDFQTHKHLKGSEPSVLAALARIYDRAKTEKCKMEVFFALKEIEHEGVLPLFEKGLADPSKNIRNVVDETIYGKYVRKKDLKVIDLLKAAAAKETDPGLKRSMEGHLHSLR